MFKREYHTFAKFYNEQDSDHADFSFVFIVKSLWSKSAKEVSQMVIDHVKELNTSDGKVVIHSITRLK